jgi:hypothetical protein
MLIKKKCAFMQHDIFFPKAWERCFGQLEKNWLPLSRELFPSKWKKKYYLRFIIIVIVLIQISTKTMTKIRYAFPKR